MAAGKTEAVLAVLEARGLTVTPDQRAQITACKDTARLDRWLRAAVTATNVADLLAS